MGTCWQLWGDVRQLLRGGPAGLTGDRQGDRCRDKLVVGSIDCPQINSAKNCESPSAELWKGCKQRGRSVGGMWKPGEEKTAEGIAKRVRPRHDLHTDTMTQKVYV